MNQGVDVVDSCSQGFEFGPCSTNLLTKLIAEHVKHMHAHLEFPWDVGSVSILKFSVREKEACPLLACIWDPGIDRLSFKKLHLFPWITCSAIIILQKLHSKNISSWLEFSLEKRRQV